MKATSDAEGVVRVQACLALGKVGLPEDATVLARVMTVDVLEDCRIAAIEGLGELKSTDPRILEVLVNGMEHDDPAIRLASVKSLRATHRQGPGAGIRPLAPMAAIAGRRRVRPSRAPVMVLGGSRGPMVRIPASDDATPDRPQRKRSRSLRLAGSRAAGSGI